MRDQSILLHFLVSEARSYFESLKRTSLQLYISICNWKQSQLPKFAEKTLKIANMIDFNNNILCCHTFLLIQGAGFKSLFHCYWSFFIDLTLSKIFNQPDNQEKDHFFGFF